eukprot:6195914-Pleurochrysis_carterae.AAC.1
MAMVIVIQMTMAMMLIVKMIMMILLMMMMLIFSFSFGHAGLYERLQQRDEAHSIKQWRALIDRTPVRNLVQCRPPIPKRHWCVDVGRSADGSRPLRSESSAGNKKDNGCVREREG